MLLQTWALIITTLRCRRAINVQLAHGHELPGRAVVILVVVVLLRLDEGVEAVGDDAVRLGGLVTPVTPPAVNC